MRVASHLRDARSGKLRYHHGHWLRKLLSAGDSLHANVLFHVPEGMRWQDAERFFIASALHFGFALTNSTRGGEGLSLTDPDAIERVSNSMRRAWADPVVKASRIRRILEANATADARDRRIAAANHPDHKAKRAEATRAALASPEARAKLSEHWKSVWASPEMKAKKSAISKAVWSDPEAAARRRAAMSEGKRLGWARKKAAQASQQID